MTTPILGILSMLAAFEQSPAPVARASEPELARSAVRAEGVIQGFDFVGLGIEASHVLGAHESLEASLAGVDLQRGLSGVYGELQLRTGVTDRRHSLTIGVGPGLLESPDFGRVAFLVPELAYEYRRLNGFSLALGLGFPVTLNDSKEVPCQETGWFSCFLETTQFHQGDWGPRFRLALGYSF